MPRAKAIANAFTAREVAEISGLTLPMVGYLAQAGFLLTSYRPGPVGRRGSVRYYSYRDLVIARIVGRLSAAGLELKRIKDALVDLQKQEIWSRLGPERSCALLITDGTSIMIREEDGSILDLKKGGQLAFAFVIDLVEMDGYVRSRMDVERLEHFDYEQRPLRLRDADQADHLRKA